MKTYTPKEKEAIFVERVKSLAPQAWDAYCDLVSHELMSVDELHALNFEKRIDIVRYAYENTKFYKRFYDEHGLKPGDIRTESDWDAVPVVTKDMVREFGEDMLAGGKDGEIFKKYGQLNSTGGSTGRPLLVYVDKRFDNQYYWHWRYEGWWRNRKPGEELSSKVAILGQNNASIWRVGGFGMDEKKLAWVNRMFRPMKQLFLDAREMTEENIQRFIAQMNEDGVVHIHAYVGAAQQMAEYLLSNNIQLKEKPSVISVTASVLTSECRHLIERAFGAPVFNVYGCNETNYLAISCLSDRDGLHVLDDLGHIDLIDEHGNPIHDERVGRVLATSFYNRVTPFVKYALGDRTSFIKKNCDCGLPFRRIAKIEGRESDWLEDVNGFKIIGWCASFDADGMEGCVLAFQFRQKIPGEVAMLIVPNRTNPRWRDQFEIYKKNWVVPFEGRLKFTIKEVDVIPHEGGKIRFIIHEKY